MAEEDVRYSLGCSLGAGLASTGSPQRCLLDGLQALAENAGVGLALDEDHLRVRVPTARSGGVRLRVQFPNRRTVWVM